MTGIIYCYTSPSGKRYIGQTRDEAYRRGCGKQLHRNYSHGGKIDNARRKYGPENFTYEILHKFECSTIEELVKEMNKWERFFIAFFDSYKQGYNSNKGGQSCTYRENSKAHKGHIVSDETKKLLRQKALGKKIKYSNAARINIAAKNHAVFDKPVLQYDLNGILIKEGSSVTEAAAGMNCARTTISDCGTKGKPSAIGFVGRLKNAKQFVKKSVPKRGKAVLKYDLNGNFVKRYDSLKSAAQDSPGNCYSNISACCLGRASTAVGYIGKYE